MRPSSFLVLLLLLLLPPLAHAQDKDKKDGKDWEMLGRFLDMSLPRSDGTKLSTESRNGVPVKKTYNDEDAKEAHRLLLRPIPGLEAKLAPFIKEHLLKVHVAAVTAVHTDDLPAFLKTLPESPPPGLSKDEKKALEALRKGEADKLPKKGWIVEVRGYTYHHKGPDLVRDTLLENMADPYMVHDLHPVMKEEIQDLSSFHMIYKTQMVKDGESGLVKNSPLRALAAEGKLGAGRKAEDKWTAAEKAPAKTDPVLTRTEFSLIFLWRDLEPAK